MKNFGINKVATCGCEITDENNQIIGWSVDARWGRILTESLLLYFEKENNYEKFKAVQPSFARRTNGEISC
jgi:hypothetical protein